MEVLPQTRGAVHLPTGALDCKDRATDLHYEPLARIMLFCTADRSSARQYFEETVNHW